MTTVIYTRSRDTEQPLLTQFHSLCSCMDLWKPPWDPDKAPQTSLGPAAGQGWTVLCRGTAGTCREQTQAQGGTSLAFIGKLTLRILKEPLHTSLSSPTLRILCTLSGSLFIYFWPCLLASGILLPWPGKLHPLHCKHEVLTTGPPGKPLIVDIHIHWLKSLSSRRKCKDF